MVVSNYAPSNPRAHEAVDVSGVAMEQVESTATADATSLRDYNPAQPCVLSMREVEVEAGRKKQPHVNTCPPTFRNSFSQAQHGWRCDAPVRLLRRSCIPIVMLGESVAVTDGQRFLQQNGSDSTPATRDIAASHPRRV